MDSRLSTMGFECGHDIHDHIGRKQTPESVGIRAGESGSMACVDIRDGVMGFAADERGALGCVREKSSQMEQITFEAAIWKAFAQCFIEYDEAIAAIAAQPANSGDKS